MSKRICMTLLLAALSGMATAQDGSQSSAQPKPKMSVEARAALARAKEVAAKVKGLKDESRRQALRTAAEAYAVVARTHADDPIGAAVANYQAAEHWRRLEDLTAAEAAYRTAAELDGPGYAERGLMGVAHMQRRTQRVEEALATYRRVAIIKPTTNRAHEARLWIARCLDTLVRKDEALKAYRNALAQASSPRQSIDAANRLANALVVGGDLAGAEAALRAADEAVRAGAEADPQDRQALEKASQGMSARRTLQRAKDKANGAGRDALQLDAHRRR